MSLHGLSWILLPTINPSLSHYYNQRNEFLTFIAVTAHRVVDIVLFANSCIEYPPRTIVTLFPGLILSRITISQGGYGNFVVVVVLVVVAIAVVDTSVRLEC